MRWRRDPDPLPFHFRLARAMIHGAREDEQQIRQPVHVREQLTVDVVDSERHDGSLGAPADRPGDMQQRTCTISTGKNESPQGRKFSLEAIDPILEPLDVFVRHSGFGDPRGNFLRRIRKRRTDCEEILLDVLEHFCDVARQLALRTDRPKTGVQLIDVAVRRNARIVLRHAGAAEQRRAARVTRARVDLHGRQYT